MKDRSATVGPFDAEEALGRFAVPVDQQWPMRRGNCFYEVDGELYAVDVRTIAVGSMIVDDTFVMMWKPDDASSVGGWLFVSEGAGDFLDSIDR